jgi:hypothetical protein|tara:strand:+ start:24557 stop:26179 length:1623 start_codon:yes stop_codon:yes gene_type:complete
MNKEVRVYKKLASGIWSVEYNTLDDARNLKIRSIVGSGKDSFDFAITNTKNRLFESFKNGNGSTTSFTLKWAYPTEWTTDEINDKFKIDVYESGVWVSKNYTSGTPSTGEFGLAVGTTLTLGDTVASGTRNIRIRYSLMEADDKIRIYIWKDVETLPSGDTALMLEGTITEPRGRMSDSGKDFSVSGYTMFENLMSGQTFVARDATRTQPHLILQTAISNLNKLIAPNSETSKRIYGQDATEWSQLRNPTTKADGSTAFPTKDYVTDYKRVYEIVEELSGSEYTGDGQYIYYVIFRNNRFEFIWKPKSREWDSSDNITEGTLVTNANSRKSTDDVWNMVIFNCGRSPKGIPVKDYVFSPGKVGGGGAIKAKYMTKETMQITSQIIDTEYQQNPTKFDNDGGTPANRVDWFPNSYDNGGGIWTFQFNAINDDGEDTGSKATCTTANTWNEEVVKRARYEGKFKAQQFLTLFQNPRYKTEVDIKLDNTQIIGKIMRVQLPYFGIIGTDGSGSLIRLMQVDHDIFQTRLYLEEDEDLAETTYT